MHSLFIVAGLAHLTARAPKTRGSRGKYSSAARLRIAEKGKKRDVYEREREKERREYLEQSVRCNLPAARQDLISVQRLRRCSGRIVGETV